MLKEWCVFIAFAIILPGLAFAGPADVISPSDGFCGLDAARACARQLGTAWDRTAQTTFLENEPFVNFGAVSQALESLGLETSQCILDQESFTSICNQFASRDTVVCGIAWIQPDRFEVDPGEFGHFVVVDAISIDRRVRLMDTQSATVSLLEINDGTRLPLLLVSRESRQPISVGLESPQLMSLRSISAVANAVLILAVSLVVFQVVQICRQHWAIASIAITLGLLGGVAWVTMSGTRHGSPEVLSASSSASTGVAFENDSYYFGELTSGLPADFDLIIYNDSERPQSVTNVTASCSCMEVTPTSFDLKPHSQQIVNVKFNAFAVGLNHFFVELHVGEVEVSQCEIHFYGIRSLRLLPLSGVVGSLSTSDRESSLLHYLSFDGDLPDLIQSVKLISGPTDTPLVLRLVKNEMGIVSDLALAISLCDDVQTRGFYYETVAFEVVCGGKTVIVDAEIGIDIID